MLSRSLEAELKGVLGSEILDSRAVSGGDINDAYRIKTAHAEYFLKVQHKPQGNAMFSAESVGLKALKDCDAIAVPEVLGHGIAASDQAYLILTWHQEIPSTSKSWTQLGEQLAHLHNCQSEAFGFHEDNFIGSLPQRNDHCDVWTDFYATMRIEPMIMLCLEYLDSTDISNWNSIRSRLSELIQCDRVSLLHGDLWGGNAMNTEMGPMIFDPAVYYGDRFVDIAMTKLFGGYPASFYDAYFSVAPAVQNLNERVDLYQLYYLLVHVALFGRSYVPSVRNILRRYA